MDKKRLKKVMIVIPSLILMLPLYKIFHKLTGLGIPCVIYELSGFYCPGCGATRMFFYLLEFNFYKAFRSNMLLFVFLPFIIVCFVDFVINYLYRKKPLIDKISNKIWYTLLGITIAFGILRNVLSFLAPIG